ncbi:MAG: YceI family protein [Aeromicrobium sp.]
MTDSSTSTTGVIVPGTYHLDPSKSRVRYSGKHMFGMGTVHATFTVQGGELRVGEPLATSSVIVTVDAASFSSNSARRDKDVRSTSLLDVARYPAITFASESLHQNGDTLLVTGTVTAHGHTVGVDVLIDHLTHEGTGIRLHGRAEHLDRTAFGITGSRGMVGRYLDLDLDAFANHRPRQRVETRPGGTTRTRVRRDHPTNPKGETPWRLPFTS